MVPLWFLAAAASPIRGRPGRSSRCSSPRSSPTSPGSSYSAVVPSRCGRRRRRSGGAAGAARVAAPPLDRRVDVLGLRLDRSRGAGQPLRRRACVVPRPPGRPPPRRRLARHDERVRPGVHAPHRADRRISGTSADAAAWIFKGLAAVTILAATVAVSRSAPPAGARCRVRRLESGARRPCGRWGPQRCPRRRARRDGGRARRASQGDAGRRCLGPRGACQVDPARVLRARRARRPCAVTSGGRGRVAVTLAVGAAVATWRYGLHWLGALGPRRQRRSEDELRAPVPARAAGPPPRRGARTGAGRAPRGPRAAGTGRARRPGAAWDAACLVLATTPYLAVWYLAWAVPLAAPEDDDRLARVAALALTAYLLPQTIPL